MSTFASVATVGVAAATGGTGAAVAAGIPFLSSLLGGGSATDQKRQASVAWTLQMANMLSVTAAEIIVAAPDNVSGHEAPYWQAALGQVRQDVLNLAYQQSLVGWWPKGGGDFVRDANDPTHQRILAEVAAADVTGSYSGTPTPTVGSSGTPAGNAQPLPAMITTARAPTPASSSSSGMWVAVGAVVVLVIVIGVFSLRTRR